MLGLGVPAAFAQVKLPPGLPTSLPTALGVSSLLPVPSTTPTLPPEVTKLLDDVNGTIDGAGTTGAGTTGAVPDASIPSTPELGGGGPAGVTPDGTSGGGGSGDAGGALGGGTSELGSVPGGATPRGSVNAGVGAVTGHTGVNATTRSGRDALSLGQPPRTIGGSFTKLAANVVHLTRPFSMPLGLAAVAIAIAFLATRRPGTLKSETGSSWERDGQRWRI